VTLFHLGRVFTRESRTQKERQEEEKERQRDGKRKERKKQSDDVAKGGG
jgi:hypothetical protein